MTKTLDNATASVNASATLPASGAGNTRNAAGDTERRGSLSVSHDGAEILPVTISNNRPSFANPAQDVHGRQSEAADGMTDILSDVLPQPPRKHAAMSLDIDIVDRRKDSFEESWSDQDWTDDEDDDDDEPEFSVDNKQQNLKAPEHFQDERSTEELAVLVGGGVAGSAFWGSVGAAIGFGIGMLAGPVGAGIGLFVGAAIGSGTIGLPAGLLTGYFINKSYGGKPQGVVLQAALDSLSREGTTNPHCQYRTDEWEGLKHVSERKMRRLLNISTYSLKRDKISEPKRWLIQKAVVHVLLKARGNWAEVKAARKALIEIAAGGSLQDLEEAVDGVLHGRKLWPSNPVPPLSLIWHQHERLDGGKIPADDKRNLSKLTADQWQDLLTLPKDIEEYTEMLALPLSVAIMKTGEVTEPVRNLKDVLIRAARVDKSHDDHTDFINKILETRYKLFARRRPPLKGVNETPLDDPSRRLRSEQDIALESDLCQDLLKRLALPPEFLSRPIDIPISDDEADEEQNILTAGDVLREALQEEADNAYDLSSSRAIADAALDGFEKGLIRIRNYRIFRERYSDLTDVKAAITAVRRERNDLKSTDEFDLRKLNVFADDRVVERAEQRFDTLDDSDSEVFPDIIQDDSDSMAGDM